MPLVLPSRQIHYSQKFTAGARAAAQSCGVLIYKQIIFVSRLVAHTRSMWAAALLLSLAFPYDPRRANPDMECALSLAEGKDGIVIDVGANGGTESMLAHRRGRKVYAFECLPSAYMELHVLFRRLYPNVTVIHACAGQHTHIGELHLAQDSSSLSANNVEQAPHGSWEHKKAMREAVPREPALVQALDGLFHGPAAGSDSARERIALVKVDTQGTEHTVLLGMQQLLRRDLPVVQYEDMGILGKAYRWFNRTGDARTSLLEPLGYECLPTHEVQTCMHVSSAADRNARALIATACHHGQAGRGVVREGDVARG